MKNLTVNTKVTSIVKEALIKFNNVAKDVIAYLVAKAERAELLGNKIEDKEIAGLHLMLAVELRTRLSLIG